MLFYALLMLLVGLILWLSMAGLAVRFHRRWGLPYALLTVGIITYIGALLVQVLLLRVIDPALMGILPLRALALGLLAGFVEETARLLGYQYLARTSATRPQALMIGLGHGFSEPIYTGLLAAGLGLSLLGYGGDKPDDTLGAVSSALAETLNGALPVIMHLALSWMVLQVFLRGELYWLFVAIFIHASSEMMAILLGPNDQWGAVIWRVIVALVSLLILVRLRAPAPAPGSGALPDPVGHK